MIPRIYNHLRRPGDPEGRREGVIVAEADHLGRRFVDDGKLTRHLFDDGVFVFRDMKGSTEGEVHGSDAVRC